MFENRCFVFLACIEPMGPPELEVWLASSCLFMRCRAIIRLLKRGGERAVFEKLEWILC